MKSKPKVAPVGGLKLKLETSKIVQVRLKEDQYYPEEFTKKQIVLHHTVSGPSAKNVMNSWATTTERVGVAFIINREGVIFQCFSSKHWAHHLGIKSKNKKSVSFDKLNGSSTNLKLNQESIGIELCSWGPLVKRGDQFLSSKGTVIPKEEVVDLGKTWKGYKYYQNYTDKQLSSLNMLLIYLSEMYKIPLDYKSDMWDLSESALAGNPGLYTHVSYRKDKSDCFPQIELSKMLQKLEQNVK